MSQRIGPRELALRAQREAASKPEKTTIREIAATLPATSGKKPVKRKKEKKR